jgi:hypothetical protein
MREAQTREAGPTAGSGAAPGAATERSEVAARAPIIHKNGCT